MSKTGFTDWLHKEIKLQQQQRKIIMAKTFKRTTAWCCHNRPSTKEINT